MKNIQQIQTIQAIQEIDRQKLILCINQLDDHKINEIIDLLRQLAQQEMELPESKETAEKIAKVIMS